MARNRVIGANGAIPWHLPEELKRFKRLTLGHHIIMGRKTWESIGRPLPGRTTVIVSRQRGYSMPGAKIAHSLDEAVAACGDDREIFVIGGAELYARALPRAGRLYLNHLDQAREQLSRNPRRLPAMKLNPAIKDLFQFQYEDFTLENYDPHPAIKAPVAV